MGFALLMHEETYAVRRLNISWMFISSILIHTLFSLVIFLYVPNFTAKKSKLQEYQVSLVPLEFLEIGQKTLSVPIPDSIPEKTAPIQTEPPVLKNAEVSMEIPKNNVSAVKPAPLTPAKFFTEPVAPKHDSVETLSPSVEKPSLEKEVPPEVPVPEAFNPEKTGISAKALIGGAGGGSGKAANGQGFVYPYYLSNIEHKISTQWSPPRTTSVGKKTRASNVAIVGFLIQQDGRIDSKSIVVEKSSGNAFFDMAALRAIHNANPMPPLPKGISDALRVHFTFAVSLDS